MEEGRCTGRSVVQASIGNSKGANSRLSVVVVKFSFVLSYALLCPRPAFFFFPPSCASIRSRSRRKGISNCESASIRSRKKGKERIINNFPREPRFHKTRTCPEISRIAARIKRNKPVGQRERVGVEIYHGESSELVVAMLFLSFVPAFR